jgi:hypothetical protein
MICAASRVSKPTSSEQMSQVVLFLLRLISFLRNESCLAEFLLGELLDGEGVLYEDPTCSVVAFN